MLRGKERYEELKAEVDDLKKDIRLLEDFVIKQQEDISELKKNNQKTEYFG